MRYPFIPALIRTYLRKIVHVISFLGNLDCIATIIGVPEDD